MWFTPQRATAARATSAGLAWPWRLEVSCGEWQPKAIATCRELVRSTRAMAWWGRVCALTRAASAHGGSDWTRWEGAQPPAGRRRAGAPGVGLGAEERVGALDTAPGDGEVAQSVDEPVGGGLVHDRAELLDQPDGAVVGVEAAGGEVGQSFAAGAGERIAWHSRSSSSGSSPAPATILRNCSTWPGSAAAAGSGRGEAWRPAGQGRTGRRGGGRGPRRRPKGPWPWAASVPGGGRSGCSWLDTPAVLAGKVGHR